MDLSRLEREGKQQTLSATRAATTRNLASAVGRFSNGPLGSETYMATTEKRECEYVEYIMVGWV